MEHNWNSGDFGSPACLRCGCMMMTVLHEATPASEAPCPGRTPEYQAKLDESFARLRQQINK